MVEHEIKVGNARPIKEPFRRLLFHATETVDKHVEEMPRDSIIETIVESMGSRGGSCVQERWPDTFLC